MSYEQILVEERDGVALYAALNALLILVLAYVVGSGAAIYYALQ